MFGKVCIIAIVDHKENLQVCFQSVNLGNIARSNNPKKRVCFCWVNQAARGVYRVSLELRARNNKVLKIRQKGTPMKISPKIYFACLRIFLVFFAILQAAQLLEEGDCVKSQT